MSIASEHLRTRQQKLSAAIKAAGLDALVLNPGPSLMYITGLHFHLSERPILGIFFPEQPPVIVLPELEAAKLDGLAYEITPFTYGEEPAAWQVSFDRGLQQYPINSLGLEDRQFRLLEYRFVQAALPETSIRDAGKVVASLRMYKDADEVAAMQRAVEVAEAALAETLRQFRIGMTEKEVASELVLQLLRHGSDGEMPFMPIVSTGPNGANPHAFPSERKLASGDLVVIDFGAAVGGYFSDITRTFGIEDVSAEQKKVHQIVCDANAAGRAVAKPGVACSDVDKAARDVIEAAGYGQYFIHRTGHGLGTEGHEPPYIRAGNPMLLEPGMSFTIEPGIYLPNRFGVRIEDDVVVTADGLTSLTSYPRELEIIGG